MTTGQHIRQLRRERRWSQRELAVRADTDTSVINRIERGKMQPGAGMVARLALALDVPPNTLRGITPADVQRTARAAVEE